MSFFKKLTQGVRYEILFSVGWDIAIIGNTGDPQRRQQD